MSSPGARLRDGLRLSVGTLTAVPVAAPDLVDRAAATVAMIAAPLAVLPVAVLAGAIGELGVLTALPSLAAAALMLGAFALGTRGLHLDGLADTADGLTASYDRDRALEIMRRGNTGPAGAATLVLVVVVQAASLAVVLTRSWGPMVGAVLLCVARSSLLITCAAGIPAARSGGLGATVAGVVPRAAGVLGGVLAGVLAVGSLLLSRRPWWLGAIAVAVAGVVVVALILRCRQRFGGITGDVLGAGIELAAAALLVVAAAG